MFLLTKSKVHFLIFCFIPNDKSKIDTSVNNKHTYETTVFQSSLKACSHGPVQKYYQMKAYFIEINRRHFFSMRKNICNEPDVPLFRKVFSPKLEDASAAAGSQRIHICTFLLVYSQYLLIFPSFC